MSSNIIEDRASKKVAATGIILHEGNSNIEDRILRTTDETEKKQIKGLLIKLPKLDELFELHRKIGEGAFSSVYLGSLRQHSALPDSEKRLFAIKHLIPTAHPARVEHELKCLKELGGKDHIIGVDLCLRHLDTIVFIMPYIPHRKFSEYVRSMDAAELRGYMRALLQALCRVHAAGVIHRDIKPGNFLYDRDTRTYMLVDFGLAQRVADRAEGDTVHAAPAPAGGLKRAWTEESPSPPAKRPAVESRAPHRALPSHPLPPGKACACWGAGAVCGACLARAGARAARAGTAGFRPPEVLLKCVRQGHGVDTWACGVVLLSALCGRYPVLRAADDAAALAELAELLGGAALQRVARATGRRLIMSRAPRGLCLRKLCARLRGAGGAAGGAARGAGGGACRYCRLPTAECLCRDPNVPATRIESGAWTCGFPDAAFALAAALLEPEPARRLSAAAALQHPFLAGEDQ